MAKQHRLDPGSTVCAGVTDCYKTYSGQVAGRLVVQLDARGNVKANTDDYRTSVEKVFSAGDMRRGQSLVVWAIREGRQCAHAIDKFMMGSTSLPR